MTRTYPKYATPSGNWTTDPEIAGRLWAKWVKEGKPLSTKNHDLTMPSTCEPVGGLEVAARLGMRPKTVTQWKLRGLLPAPRWTVSGEDAWDWEVDIEPWARRTGRLRNGQAAGGPSTTCEYREVRDPQYAHLVSPSCACGWTMGGYVKRQTARSFWDSHKPRSTGASPRAGKVAT